MSLERGVTLSLDPEVLRPLIRQIAAEVAESLRQAEAAVPGGRMAYSEQEAARLLGLNAHQLRDERCRGRVVASKIVGGRVRYTPEALRAYLTERVATHSGCTNRL
jgi:hypothetical protein